MTQIFEHYRYTHFSPNTLHTFAANIENYDDEMAP